MQCVGETGNAMHTRMNSHHSDIRTKMLNKQIAPHFSIEGLEVMGIEKTHQDNNMSCRKQQESYGTIELRALVPYGLALIANSLGDTESRNHDNASMFLVNMYCVLSVNVSVARAASVVYYLKMVHIEPKLCIRLKFCVVQRLCGFA